MAQKKAYMKTLEGAVATMLILMFVLYIMPHSPTETKIEEPTKTFIMDTLSTLDQSGLLEESLVRPDPNTTQVEDALREIISQNLNISLKYTTLNSSAGTLPSPGSHATVYLNFTSNATTLEKSTLTLYFKNSTDPKVTLNSVPIYEPIGTKDNKERLDLTLGTINGSNTLNITTKNPAEISYVLNLHDRTSTPYIPTDRPTAAVTYLIHGNRTTFSPGALTVYIWER